MSHSDTPSPSATHSSSASHEQSTIPQLGAHPEIEAAVFRRLVQHLQDRSEVQNIDLMNLADFCRNCLSKWYQAAAEEQGIKYESLEAREMIYGMPYGEWKKMHQKPATAEQLARFNK